MMNLLKINFYLSKIIIRQSRSAMGNKIKIFLKVFHDIHDETILLNRSTKYLT